MEVAERTAADRKGGHLARRGDRLVLRESAQCAPEDEPAFQDITRHRYFNTNSLWLDLDALHERLANAPEGLPLPVISNAKTVLADDPDSPPCLQLETAMGAAIESFEGRPGDLRFPRTLRPREDDGGPARGPIGRVRTHRGCAPGRDRSRGESPARDRSRQALLSKRSGSGRPLPGGCPVAGFLPSPRDRRGSPLRPRRRHAGRGPCFGSESQSPVEVPDGARLGGP